MAVLIIFLTSKDGTLLIEVFARGIRQNPPADWKLILAGPSQSEQECNHYLLHLRQLAKSLPIEFSVNPDFPTLKNIYSQSKLYWHAAGYGIDESKNPEKAEHFGISLS